MQDEADITTNGTKLNDSEAATVRVAIDTLANVLAEELGLDRGIALTDRGIALTDKYIPALSRIQTLLESKTTNMQ